MPADFQTLARLLSLSAENRAIINIGNAGTDFDALGGLTLASFLNVTGRLAWTANTFAFQEAMTISTPAATALTLTQGTTADLVLGGLNAAAQIFLRGGLWRVNDENNANVMTWDLSTDAFAFQKAITISTTAGDLTLNPTDNIIAGAGVFYRSAVTATITASTTQTQGQGALVSEVNEISVCANVNDTVTLPSAIAGMRCVVINNGAQTLRIFPASGDNLGAGVDTATTLAAAATVVYQAFDATNWESI